MKRHRIFTVGVIATILVASAVTPVGATNHADPNALNTLAAAQAELGQFGPAVQTVTQAIALANQHGTTALVGPLQERLALYRSGKPFRR